MDAKGVERVIVAEHRFHLGAGQIWHGAGKHTDDDRAGRVHEAGGRCDHDQPGDRAGTKTQNRGVAAEQFFDHAPRERGDSGGERGRHEGVGRYAIGGEGAAGVEAIPADPEHAGADHAEDEAVRRHFFLTEPKARSENNAENQRGPTGGHVNHGATGEVDRLDDRVAVPDAVHEARDAPDHVGQREVDDDHPDRDEEQNRGELHAFGDRADDQRRSDDREHHLVHRKHILRNPVGVVGVGRAGDAFQEEKLRAAEERTVEALAEDQAVAERPPHDGDEAGDTQALGEDGEDVLLADETAVEEGETGQRHEEHERGAGHHPGVVAGAGHANQRAFDRIDVVDVGLKRGEALFGGGRGRCGGRLGVSLGQAGQG